MSTRMPRREPARLAEAESGGGDPRTPRAACDGAVRISDRVPPVRHPRASLLERVESLAADVSIEHILDQFRSVFLIGVLR